MSLCLFCDGECSVEAYRKDGTLEEILDLLMRWKICAKHAQELDKIHEEKEKVVHA